MVVASPPSNQGRPSNVTAKPSWASVSPKHFYFFGTRSRRQARFGYKSNPPKCQMNRVLFKGACYARNLLLKSTVPEFFNLECGAGFRSPGFRRRASIHDKAPPAESSVACRCGAPAASRIPQTLHIRRPMGWAISRVLRCPIPFFEPCLHFGRRRCQAKKELPHPSRCTGNGDPDRSGSHAHVSQQLPVESIWTMPLMEQSGPESLNLMALNRLIFKSQQRRAQSKPEVALSKACLHVHITQALAN